MKSINITMVRGDTLSFGVEPEGLNQDLESAYFSCKQEPNDSTYTFQKSLGNGITKAEANKYRIRVAPEDTKNIDIGNYYYDFEIGVNSDVFTILKGLLTVEQDITT